MDKCVDAANNVLVGRLRNNKWKYVMKSPNINPENIMNLGENCFLVPSETLSDVSYMVDMNMRSCSCPVGVSRGPCKHKMIISLTKNLPSFDVVPTDNPEMRKVFMYLGTGKSMQLDWFLPLRHPASNSGPGTEHEQIDPNRDADDVQIMDTNGVSTMESCASATDEFEDATVVEEKLNRALSLLQEKISLRIEKDPAGYSKALDILEKTIKRLPDSVDSALQKSLSQFGKSVTQSSSVLKRKKIGLIPVQVTAKSRRVYKIRGSRSAVAGRPRLGLKLSVQMNVDDENEDDGVLRHKLPTKKRKKGDIHDLMSSVGAGRGPSKKH